MPPQTPLEPQASVPEQSNSKLYTVALVAFFLISGGIAAYKAYEGFFGSAGAPPVEAITETANTPAEIPQTLYVSRKAGIGFYYPSAWTDVADEKSFKDDPELVALFLIPHADTAYGSLMITKTPANETIQEYATFLKNLAESSGKEVLRENFSAPWDNGQQTYQVFTGQTVAATADTPSYEQLEMKYVWPYQESDSTWSYVELTLSDPVQYYEADYLLAEKIVLGTVTGAIEEYPSTHPGN